MNFLFTYFHDIWGLSHTSLDHFLSTLCMTPFSVLTTVLYFYRNNMNFLFTCFHDIRGLIHTSLDHFLTLRERLHCIRFYLVHLFQQALQSTVNLSYNTAPQPTEILLKLTASLISTLSYLQKWQYMYNKFKCLKDVWDYWLFKVIQKKENSERSFLVKLGIFTPQINFLFYSSYFKRETVRREIMWIHYIVFQRLGQNLYMQLELAGTNWWCHSLNECK